MSWNLGSTSSNFLIIYTQHTEALHGLNNVDIFYTPPVSLNHLLSVHSSTLSIWLAVYPYLCTLQRLICCPNFAQSLQKPFRVFTLLMYDRLDLVSLKLNVHSSYCLANLLKYDFDYIYFLVVNSFFWVAPSLVWRGAVCCFIRSPFKYWPPSLMQ